MPGLARRFPPLVVTAIRIFHGRGGQFGGIDPIEAGDLDRDIVPADFLEVSFLERTHTAVFAEKMRALPAAEAVITEIILAGQQAKRVGLDDRSPVARLGADRAI